MALRATTRVLDSGGGFFTTTSTTRLCLLGLDREGFFCTQRPLLHLVVASSRNPGKPRAPLWRGRVLSNESLRVVQELKRAKAAGDDARVSTTFKTRITRLLQFDLLAVLTELQRQNECDLALKVFDMVRKEYWYKPDASIYAGLVKTMARKSLMEEVDKLYLLAAKEGLEPSEHFYTEVLIAHVDSGNLQKGMQLYDEMRNAGLFPCSRAYGHLRRGLIENGDVELAATLENECEEALGGTIPNTTEHVVLT